MNLTFENKVALVTGAGAGMGLAAAKAFAQSGAAVAMADIHEASVRAPAAELAAAGHKVLALRCDVSDDAQVKATVDHTISTFGRLDAAFNNAGVQSPAVESADSTREEFDRVRAINLRSVWSCMKYELVQMRKQGSGAIVNNSSIGGPQSTTHQNTGLSGSRRARRWSMPAKGIRRINAICPGTIDTPIVQEMIAKDPQAMKETLREQPIGRLGRAEEIASAVLWLCGPGSTFVIGHALAVDGGFTAH